MTSTQLVEDHTVYRRTFVRTSIINMIIGSFVNVQFGDKWHSSNHSTKWQVLMAASNAGMVLNYLMVNILEANRV